MSAEPRHCFVARYPLLRSPERCIEIDHDLAGSRRRSVFTQRVSGARPCCSLQRSRGDDLADVGGRDDGPVLGRNPKTPIHEDLAL